MNTTKNDEEEDLPFSPAGVRTSQRRLSTMRNAVSTRRPGCRVRRSRLHEQYQRMGSAKRKNHQRERLKKAHLQRAATSNAKHARQQDRTKGSFAIHQYLKKLQSEEQRRKRRALLALPQPQRTAAPALQTPTSAKKKKKKATGSFMHSKVAKPPAQPLFGSTKIKKRLLKELLPPPRGTLNGHAHLITGPPGCGKSFVLSHIASSYTRVLTTEHVESLCKQGLDVPRGRNTLVCVDDVEDLTDESALFLKHQIVPETKAVPSSTTKKKKKKKRKKSLPEVHSNPTSFVLCCKNVFDLSKSLRWLREVRQTKLFAPWESDVKRFLFSCVRVKTTRSDGTVTFRPPLHSEVNRATTLSRRNLRAARMLIENGEGAGACDVRLNVFDEVRGKLTHTLDPNWQLTDVSRLALHENACENCDDDLERLAGVFDSMSLSDTLQHSKIGQAVYDDCFTHVPNEPDVSFPSLYFSRQRDHNRHATMVRHLRLLQGASAGMRSCSDTLEMGLCVSACSKLTPTQLSSVIQRTKLPTTALVDLREWHETMEAVFT